MMRDTFELEDIQIIKNQMAKVKELHPNRPFIDQIGRWIESRAQDQLQGIVGPDNQQRSYGKGRHGLEFNMNSLLETLEKMKTIDDLIAAYFGFRRVLAQGLANGCYVYRLVEYGTKEWKTKRSSADHSRSYLR